MISKVEAVNKDSDFYQCMYGICTDVAQADEVVKLLEDISSGDPMPFSREFCISYVIKLLEKYCSVDDCELALARYGFLYGFDRKKYKRIEKRTEEYWNYARRYNQHEFISGDWTTTGTALTKLRDRHMIIVGNLDKITSQIKSKNDGKLGLIKEVSQELEYPKPREIIEDVSQAFLGNKEENDQMGVENEISSEGGTLGNFLPKEGTLQSGLRANPERDGSIEQEGNKGNGETPRNPPAGLPPWEKSNETKFLSYERLKVIALFFIASILCFAFIIRPLLIEKANTDKATEPPVDPVENPLLAADAPVDSALLVEAESFTLNDIGEDNKIQVSPNIPRKLDIELEPQDADISTLAFKSSSPDIVDAEYGYITASDNIAAGETYFVDITIIAQKTGYEEVVHVKAENPVIPDNTDNPTGDGITEVSENAN